MNFESSSILKNYQPVIGLEVHCQLETSTKLFCACSTQFGALPNKNTCPICLGLPGVLPVLNKKVVDFAVKLAIALGGKVQRKSLFARKQYFYPDLPKGYQISQFEEPYCIGGSVELDSGFVVELNRIHIEEDAGKNVHGDNASYVDLNRAGIPLLEIVTEPVIHSPTDAVDYLKKLRSIVRYLKICDGNLEEGSFRCDANVSVRLRGSDDLNVRTEIKNLNSFKNIEKAITYEIFRQVDCIENNIEIVEETLLFDASTGKTHGMRSKEGSQDYRYFPDPDLTPLILIDERVEDLKSQIPELPHQKSKRFQEIYKLNVMDSAQLCEEVSLANYFESIVELINGKLSPKIVANWVVVEWMKYAKEFSWTPATSPISAEKFAELLCLLGEKTISGKIAKKVFDLMVTEELSAREIVEKYQLIQILDRNEIVVVVDAVLKEYPDQLSLYLEGKQKVFGFFVGQIMKRSRGKFNPALVNEILKERVDANR